MFKVNHLFGNGSNGSVPSIGGGTPSLASALAQVERAEAALEAARRQAKAAARREGRGVRNLFSEGKFVARASAERWCDTARSEGECAGMSMLTDHLLRAQGRDPDEVRAEMAASTKRDRAAAEARNARWKSIVVKTGFFEATAAGNHAEAGQILLQMHDVLTQADAHVVPRHVVERMERERPGKTKADQIVAAARRSRMSADAAGEVPEPAKGSLAAQIVRAGAKRRGEIE
jgi:hypothetical protein